LLFINTNEAPPDLQLNFGLSNSWSGVWAGTAGFCAASWDDIVDNAHFGSAP
jgi:hypothetical protein